MILEAQPKGPVKIIGRQTQLVVKIAATPTVVFLKPLAHFTTTPTAIAC
jgi:hypothetical protein